MTDERGTGDIGKKPKSKKTKVAIFIIAVLGLGILSPFVLPILDTPAERVSDVVELNNDGVSAREAEAVDQKMQLAAKIAKNTSARAVISTNTTEKVETVVDDTLETLPTVVQADSKASPENADTEIVPAAVAVIDSTEMLPFAAQENANTLVDDQKTPIQSEDKTTASAEDLILNSAMPATDNETPAVLSEIASTPTVATNIPSHQPTVQPGISTTSGTDITSIGQSVEPSAKDETPGDIESKAIQQYKPEDFGITDEQIQQVQATEIQNHLRQSRVNNQALGEYGQAYRVDESNNQLKNYVGEAKEAEYQMQDQNTVYLYSNFAAKIYLLPLDKNDAVNAYLSDPKGWEVKLLPGGIFRINRSDDKAKWTQATDLFIIAGKRTYTIILQGVGEPSIRTDSLRYHLPKSDVKKAR